MTARKIPKRARGSSGTPPTMSWVALARAMNSARLDDHKWNALRPDAIRFIQRRNSRMDAAEANATFNAMRKYTPGVPPAGIDDDDE